MKIFGFNITRSNDTSFKTSPKSKPQVTGIDPGRVSVPEGYGDILSTLKGLTSMVEPSFRLEVIDLIRKLYKVNPDVSKALLDMFQLTNTGHQVQFPNNSDKEAEAMLIHLNKASKTWSNYTAGIDGLINKMIVQCFVGGAISIEAVPNNKLDGISTILFIKPDSILFKRENNGEYQPYQRVNTFVSGKIGDYVKLNLLTYKYVSMYNDTDEPYGIPFFMAALDSLKSQADMKVNFKHIMENAGMLGFMEALIEKPERRANESIERYQKRLSVDLRNLKIRLKEGVKDGLVVGYQGDHEFKLNSTTENMGNIDKPWTMNQQSIANGLGINGSLIGISTANTEGGAGINLSKLISQLKSIQMIVGYVLEFIYDLELKLAGFNNKGIKIVWYPATVSDDIKLQQAKQYKVTYLETLYKAGIISQLQYAREMGYDQPDIDEPRVPLEDNNSSGSNTPEDPNKRNNQKSKSARKTRDKNKIIPKRRDQDPRST